MTYRITKTGAMIRMAFVAAVLIPTSGCGVYRMLTMDKPPASEFGLGPRTSANGLYVATIETAAPLRKGALQKVQLLVLKNSPVAGPNAGQSPSEGATIVIDGGMPQHGHGLPTAPRVTRSLGGGRYQVEGLKFNMGGWWELRFRITTDAGTDSITFNLDI